MRILHYLIASIFLITILSANANTHYFPDKRAQLPKALNNSYLGMGVGYTDIPYSNTNLINGFQANSFTNPSVGLNVFLGHYFNPYLAAQISLMRPIKWAYANNIPTVNGKHSIWISIFGFSLRPTMPITQRLSAYGIAGLGLISRHGFAIRGVTAISSTVVPTFLTGGGLTYALTPHWHLNAGVDYTVARPSQQQPATLYAYTSFYYLFHTLHLPPYYTTHYIFHKNLIQFGLFDTKVFDPDVNKYFSIHYLPIFWTGDVHTRNGAVLMYERNVFHTHKRFSLDIGTSISSYHSAINNTAFETFSIFPDIRLWLIRSPSVDFYFMYSVAGPSYVTRRVIDNTDTGGHFSFQDLLGFGFFFGKEKRVNLDFRIGHYSNGNSLPINPGIQVPLTVSMGYAFK
ncbi:MAG: hypothetical protein COY58_09475 [Gammaproteobacteria bacterium CG_4_10_14_0_8_um_filter_38_16]|nr:MAG: hypothetical protein COY58_09475 [Gammaproteobacteria bacterium CG_4_10_14_0_8_um_filter_38_16]PJA03082.1 MAG: hypothetical protein COX72_07190 [Gammaproteobacteria bacterium CG_4_10_14_0_2_um_filter_38_22]PJB10297.1 MAG: hypothetical protein CO120_05715 [Gammaproteobacteria bacterium CG_4_9_14_3_um_filter_38_9]